MVGRGSRIGSLMKSAIPDTGPRVSVPVNLRHRVTFRELWLFVAAFPVVATVRLALSLLPSRTILRIVRRSALTSFVEVAHPRVPASLIAWAVEAVSRRVPGATCLTQALAAKLLLRCFGQDAQLCLGVARSSDRTFRAHAWLERNGRPLLGGAGVQSLVRLPQLPDVSNIAESLTR